MIDMSGGRRVFVQCSVLLSVFYIQCVLILTFSVNDESDRTAVKHHSVQIVRNEVEQQEEEIHKPFKIYMYTEFWSYFDQDFSECKYSNCEIEYGFNNTDHTGVNNARIVMFHHSFMKFTQFPALPNDIRRNQLWMLQLIESPSRGYNRLDKYYGQHINMTITYRSDADIPITYHPTKIIKRAPDLPRDYSAGKTRGAFAYVSNCNSDGYNRLNLMRQIGRYIDVDIFGGCGRKPPCRAGDVQCESKLHSSYHFYLSFENSLCMEYITEKFWERLASPGNFVPIALGGLSSDEYRRQAPTNSFIHVYDYNSTERLGKHLQYLMSNSTAYNQLHEWRRSETMIFDRGLPACEICQLATQLPKTPSRPDLATWWNGNRQKPACRMLNMDVPNLGNTGPGELKIKIPG